MVPFLPERARSKEYMQDDQGVPVLPQRAASEVAAQLGDSPAPGARA